MENHKTRNSSLLRVLLNDIVEKLKKNLGKIILMYLGISLLYLFYIRLPGDAMFIIVVLLAVIAILSRQLPPLEAYHDYDKWKEWVKSKKLNDSNYLRC